MAFTDFLYNILRGAGAATNEYLHPGSSLGQGIRNLFQGPESISGHAMPVPGYQPQPPPDNGYRISGSLNGPESTTYNILKQLQALSDPSRYMMSPEQLMQQAQGQVGAQYDPQIAALRAAMSGAETRGNRNRDTVIGMFNGLSDNLHGEVQPQINQYQQAKTQTGQEYTDLKSSINQQYDQSQKQQEDLYNRLNIQAAATDVVPQQQTDRNFFVGQAGAKNQTAQNALSTEQQGAVDFTNRGSQNARVEGQQRGADIMTQLSDMLNQYQAQIGAQEAAKAQAYSSVLAGLQQSSQKNALDMAQRDFTNYISAAQLGRGFQSDQLNQLKMQQSMLPSAVKQLSDISGRALGLGFDQNQASQMTSLFGQALSDPQVMAGMDPGTGQQLSAEAKASLIVEQGRAAGLSPQELNALQTMALEYFGRR